LRTKDQSVCAISVKMSTMQHVAMTFTSLAILALTWLPSVRVSR